MFSWLQNLVYCSWAALIVGYLYLAWRYFTLYEMKCEALHQLWKEFERIHEFGKWRISLMGAKMGSRFFC